MEHRGRRGEGLDAKEGDRSIEDLSVVNCTDILQYYSKVLTAILGLFVMYTAFHSFSILGLVSQVSPHHLSLFVLIILHFMFLDLSPSERV